ncbi:hypothetical protein CR513_39854, partial [Mucuna pruriens]
MQQNSGLLAKIDELIEDQQNYLSGRLTSHNIKRSSPKVVELTPSTPDTCHSTPSSTTSILPTVSLTPKVPWKNAGQLKGLPTKDPLAHLKKFLRFANMIKINNVPINIIRLRLFPFSLANRAFESNIHLSHHHDLTSSRPTTTTLNRVNPKERGKGLYS